jgi:predicted RNA-binding Zn-ribbon protein involved in translation (DUF1610 family)
MPENPPPLGSNSKAPSVPGGESIDEGRGRIFPCEECGADLKYNIGAQQLKCPFCGHVKIIEHAEDTPVEEQDFRSMLARLEELRTQEKTEEPDQCEVGCESCGAGVVFIGTLTSSECPYCGSPIQRENIHSLGHRIPVDGLLAFRVPKETAQTRLTEWVRSRWFAPNEFRKRGVRGRFNGVYLPFWTYDAFTSVRYSGQRGEHYTVTIGTGKNRRTERRTRWYPASGDFQRFFDDMLVLAAQGMHRDLMHSLEPWPLRECAPFKQDYLAGYSARTYDLPLQDGFVEAKDRIDAAIEADVRNRIGGDVQRIHSLNTHYGAITFKHLLLPTWLLAYRYRDKPYQVVVNATTGEVQGERPYSWIKITLAVLAAASVAALVFVLTQS